MRHLLGIEGLTKKELYAYLNNAKTFVEVGNRELKKVPALRGRTIINLFLEPSTRTRTSFEIAGKRMSADVVNIGAPDSSTKKGETLLDTARTLQAMSPDVLVVRHSQSGAPHFLARMLKNTSVVNAGDGTHEHPTQALLDLLTIMQAFEKRPDGIEKLRVAIVGDVHHSRVARSNVWAHHLLGNEVHLVGPPALVSPDFVGPKCFGAPQFGGKIKVFHQIERGLEGADVVIVLRMQLERQHDHFVPTLQEYTDEFCVTENRLMQYAPQAVVLHPGPMNRGTEISSEVADGDRSLVERQVNNGVAVRMGVLFAMCNAQAQRGATSVDEREQTSIQMRQTAVGE